MKINKKYIIGLIIIFMLLVIINQKIEIVQLENAANIEVELSDCPFCHSNNININPVNNSFYIECGGCELRTDYFLAREKLIDYWNRIE